ncbi:MAG: hypothetical protein JWM58_3848 [Rhizobium sp.]|nr:hypothetical protein [Rhizobium sp.]
MRMRSEFGGKSRLMDMIMPCGDIVTRMLRLF